MLTLCRSNLTLLFKETLFRRAKELEIVIGDEHISFTTSKIGSLIDVNQSKDPGPERPASPSF